MNRKKGLFGLSAAAGVVAATSLLATAGTGSAATGNSAAAFGVQSSGAEPHAHTPFVSTTTGATHTASGGTKGDFVRTGGASVTTSLGKASATVLSFNWGYGTVRAAVVTTKCSNGTATVTVSGATPSALNGTYRSAKTVNITGGTVTVHTAYNRAAGTGAYGLSIRAGADSIQVAGATCQAAPQAQDPTPTSTTTSTPTSTSTPTATSTPTDPPSDAPTPTPTETNLPVTG
jgi:hypothetical protein